MNVCESDGVCVCVHGQDAGMNVCESVLPFEERHVSRTFCSDGSEWEGVWLEQISWDNNHLRVDSGTARPVWWGMTSPAAFRCGEEMDGAILGRGSFHPGHVQFLLCLGSLLYTPYIFIPTYFYSCSRNNDFCYLPAKS